MTLVALAPGDPAYSRFGGARSGYVDLMAYTGHHDYLKAMLEGGAVIGGGEARCLCGQQWVSGDTDIFPLSVAAFQPIVDWWRVRLPGRSSLTRSKGRLPSSVLTGRHALR
jgi:hypothetical protein